MQNAVVGLLNCFSNNRSKLIGQYGTVLSFEYYRLRQRWWI